MNPSACPCGAESIWGALATVADVAAWTDAHAGHVAPPDAPSLLADVAALGLNGTDDGRGGVHLTFPDAVATRAAAGLLRETMGARCTVGIVDCAILARPRAGWYGGANAGKARAEA